MNKPRTLLAFTTADIDSLLEGRHITPQQREDIYRGVEIMECHHIFEQIETVIDIMLADKMVWSDDLQKHVPVLK